MSFEGLESLPADPLQSEVLDDVDDGASDKADGAESSDYPRCSHETSYDPPGRQIGVMNPHESTAYEDCVDDAEDHDQREWSEVIVRSEVFLICDKFCFHIS